MTWADVEGDVITAGTRETSWFVKVKQGLQRYLQGNIINAIPLLLIALILFVAVFGDFIIPYDPIEMDLMKRLNPPSNEHILGNDEFGRDIFSRVIAGTRISVRISVLVVLSTAFVGTIVGTISGMSGGFLDEILMRMTDLFLAFPPLLLAIIISATLGAGLTNTMIALVIVYWPWYARIIRGEVLSLREREYILAAHVIGVNQLKIIRRHILPNIMPILITQATLDIGFIILETAGLSFLGLGAQPPTPEWGAMLLDARKFFPESWWYSFFPGFALSITVLSINLLGDGLRDFLDPRLRVR